MVKLFAHRGFVAETHQENSVASLNEAVTQGFSGVEFDIWLFEEKLVLKHDQPVVEEITTLPNLKDYFSHKNSLTYWLDFKKLDEKNSAAALNLVKQEIEAADISLDQIYFATIAIDFEKASKICAVIRNFFGEKAQIIAVRKSVENEKEVQELRQFLDQNNLKFLSIFHQLISESFVKVFAGIEIFAWTVNDVQRLQELETLGIRNFATDKITPQIYGKKT